MHECAIILALARAEANKEGDRKELDAMRVERRKAVARARAKKAAQVRACVWSEQASVVALLAGRGYNERSYK